LAEAGEDVAPAVAVVAVAPGVDIPAAGAAVVVAVGVAAASGKLANCRFSIVD
jgi:hypothetical protein